MSLLLLLCSVCLIFVSLRRTCSQDKAVHLHSYLYDKMLVEGVGKKYLEYVSFQCVAWVWPQSLRCVALIGENIIAK